ncbi:MAG: Rid family detoxifying hydrolase [Chloroflexota bacterium]|jgi:2-iminobutanoate/2-iminopropanoate deaminase|nr:Rid family detoxifying hydrolase [Chloroflexota bacterium]
MAIEVIQDLGSAAPVGPYSQGIKAGGFVFVAGEKGIDPDTGKIIDGGIQAETKQTFANIEGILLAAGATLEQVVATTVHMVNLEEFQQMNEIYATFFKNNPPGRTTVGVTSLPAGANVEITVTAYIGD